MVRPARFELATFGSVDQRSIQLSYGRSVYFQPLTPNYHMTSTLFCDFAIDWSFFDMIGFLPAEKNVGPNATGREKKMTRPTEAKIKNTNKPGRHGLGHCLFLRVKPSGSKSFVQRMTINGKRHDLGLGPWPLVSLAEALEKAIRNRRVARIDKGDPRGNSPAGPTPTTPSPTTPTFREMAKRTHDANLPRWSQKHAENCWAVLENYAFRSMGDMPLNQITEQHILKLLAPMWQEKNRVAELLRQRIGGVFEYATALELVNHNPSGKHISAALPKPRRVIKNLEALPYDRVGAALTTLEASTAGEAVKLAVRWTVLTACRSQEARQATWAEIDEEKALWVIDGVRMKSGAEHRVPLSAAAMEVLRQAKGIQGEEEGGLLFPSPTTGKALSHPALLKSLRSCGAAKAETLHGMRTAFRTWAEECTDADHAVKELCLAHRVGSAVERAYNRTALVEKRRALMTSWADYLSGRQPASGGYATSWDQVRAS